MMKQMEEVNARREAEVKMILEAKDRQIERILKTEKEKMMITDSLKAILVEEREKSNKEMQEFLKTFQKQQHDTAERYAMMPPEVRAELENQKQAARNIYTENEMRKSFANNNMKMPA